MINESVVIEVGEAEQVSGIVSAPEAPSAGNGTGVIIAHGAGNDMHNPLIVSFSQGLAEAGYIALRFNFPYKEKGRKTPDSAKKLVQTWQSVYRFLKEDSGHRTDMFVAAGKSMGGRIASQMVAEGLLPADRLVLLGYPLHPPGKKEKLRDAHLYQIKIPMLFFAGTRDPFCDLTLMQNVLDRLTASWELETIEAGDHSFNLPKSALTAQKDVYDRILQKSIDWLEGRED